MARRDPVELEIFKNIFHSIAEEMGAALRRTAFSPNIKERRDYSCAVFDGAGEVIAMGDHMPVHLGSMPMSVRAAIERLEFTPGDVAMLNDPFAGGTHLPDITMVMPVWVGEGSDVRTKTARMARMRSNIPKKRNVRNLSRVRKVPPDFFVAARAHHSDIGGTYAGSMGLCREVYQEGLRIPPVKLMRGGQMDLDVLTLVLNNVRTPQEREGDLGAQIAACNTGATRLGEISSRYGLPRMKRAASDLLEYSEELMRAFLAQVPPGEYAAEDFLDDDGVSSQPVRLSVRIRIGSGSCVVDFTGSDPQVEGSINAVEAITWSAVFYVFRGLLAEDVPATAGLLRPIQVIAPAGTVVNARPPGAVAGGNVETSQRIVDVLLRALAQALPERIPAAASGTMNNLTIGGVEFLPEDECLTGADRAQPRPYTSQAHTRQPKPFAYYETVAGGMGARPTKDGVSGVHTHMTNSLNTPAEALEYAYPFRVTRYSLRRGSGGPGKYRGGDGIVREIEVLADAEVTILSDRRKRGPYGLAGGGEGQPGKTEIIRLDGSVEILPSKGSARLKKGERVRVETPGGGGFGKQ